MTETNVSLTLDATNAFLPGSTSDVLVEPDQDVKSAARFLRRTWTLVGSGRLR